MLILFSFRNSLIANCTLMEATLLMVVEVYMWKPGVIAVSTLNFNIDKNFPFIFTDVVSKLWVDHFAIPTLNSIFPLMVLINFLNASIANHPFA